MSNVSHSQQINFIIHLITEKFIHHGIKGKAMKICGKEFKRITDVCRIHQYLNDVPCTAPRDIILNHRSMIMTSALKAFGEVDIRYNKDDIEYTNVYIERVVSSYISFHLIPEGVQPVIEFDEELFNEIMYIAYFDDDPLINAVAPPALPAPAPAPAPAPVPAPAPAPAPPVRPSFKGLRETTDEEEECCVCFIDTSLKTGCGHTLCGNCYFRLPKKTCPLCRGKI